MVPFLLGGTVDSSRVVAVGARLFGLAVWLGGLWLVSTLLIGLTEGRIGTGRNTSYGHATSEFAASWGGEVVASPPAFTVHWETTEHHLDEGAQQARAVSKPQQAEAGVERVELRGAFACSSQRWGSLTIPSYTVETEEHYRVRSAADVPARLQVSVARPTGASVLNDYSLTVAGTRVSDPRLDAPTPLHLILQPGEETDVAVRWSTKGSGAFSYALSALRGRVVPSAAAAYTFDCDRFALTRFGLNHQRVNDNGGATVTFALANFSTTQDIGFAFESQRQAQEFAASLLQLAPMAVFLYMLALLVWSQVAPFRLAAWAYLPVVASISTYFLFVGYLVRWLSDVQAAAAAFAIALGLLAAVAGPIFGRQAALRCAFPYFVLLTLGFSGIHALPTLRGLVVGGFIFVNLAVLLVAAVRSDPTRWTLFSSATRERQ